MDASFPLFVRDLNGKAICLSVSSSQILGSVKATLQDVTGIPAEDQVLAYRHSLDDGACLSEQDITANAVISLTGRLRGGKGGFGSLLRGSGKGAVTENEDACRDLSGRRLRLVNAEKKLQEWAAADKQRRDEKASAREEKERAKAEQRQEAAQVELEAVRKDQAAVLSKVALALQSSMKEGNKRTASAPAQTRTKKPRYGSDSEDEDSEEDGDDSSDDEGLQAVAKGAQGGASDQSRAAVRSSASEASHQPSTLQAVT
jgi:hypothetical protein